LQLPSIVTSTKYLSAPLLEPATWPEVAGVSVVSPTELPEPLFPSRLMSRSPHVAEALVVFFTSTLTASPVDAGYITHQSSSEELAIEPEAEPVIWVAFPMFVPAELVSDLTLAAVDAEARAMSGLSNIMARSVRNAVPIMATRLRLSTTTSLV
jgi:hypothetical protein